MRLSAPFLVLFAVIALRACTPDPLPAQSAPSETPRRVLVWAVDGLSHEAFVVAQQRGLFRRFSQVGRHVAPYPSMSHPSWSEVTGTTRLFGTRGTLRSVEAAWFDAEASRIADDPRQVFARQAGPFSYMRAFDWFFDPLTEPLMYFDGDRMADRELAEAERELLERFTGDHHVVFLGAADAIAHTHLNGLHRYLARLDATMSRVRDSLAARGVAISQFIVSDHGNVGAFAEGAPERRLTPVSFASTVRRAGLVQRDTGRLVQPSDISIVTLALASMVNVHFADLSRRRAFATAALQNPAVDLVTWLEVRGDDRWIVIAGAGRGEAQLRWRADGALQYTVVSGNPLGIPEQLLSRVGVARWISDSAMRAATMHGAYPDAPFRLVRSATGLVADAPDLIVSLRDGYCWAGSLGKYVKMVRTHGALSARATLGVVASTDTHIPAYVRSEEVLALTGLDEASLFHRVRTRVAHDAAALADSLLAAPGVVATGRDEEGADATFLRRVKPITLSAEYLDIESLRALWQAAHADSVTQRREQQRLSATRSALRRTRVVDGVSRHIDTLLALVDPLPTSTNGDTLRRLLDRADLRLRGIPELAPLSTLRDIWRTADEGHGGVTLRRATMAAWTLPYLLDAALDAPETDSIDDPRDRSFAVHWHRALRDSVRRMPEVLRRDSTLAPRLLAEVLRERMLLRQVEGATVPTLYDAPIGDVTVVYVPGIFGELFDDEIWRRGLHSLREQLGVRVVSARTDGRCSASDNATTLLSDLQRDTRQRLARGHAKPRYVVLGYSKGGIDAAEALVRASQDVREQVLALVTIATPHGGSPVAERADIPDALLGALIPILRPVGCDTTRAVESLWPANRAAFWSGAGSTLGRAVPLYSVSLVSDMREAHPWMKITKRIARFGEENDGVVSRSSARFPETVPSVHLGEIRGDHIAARGASAFPQESVLESLLLTLNEIGALDSLAPVRWRAHLSSSVATTSTPSDTNAADNGASGPNDRRDTARGSVTSRPRQELPGTPSGWTPTKTFRMNRLESLTEREVTEATASTLPHGIDIRCDQVDMRAFREEYEFLYDAGNGGGENSIDNGFSITTAETGSGRACRLHTRRSAMKMTTVAFRFAPSTFARLSLRLKVNRAVTGVAPDKGGRGRNDASFKLWFVLRDERPASKGRRLLFGYTWAGRDANGNVPVADSLMEAGASRRRIAFSVLPEAWLVNVGGPSLEGAWAELERDFARDVQRAYPGVPLDALRVIAITVQTDSDDSRGETDVLLDRLTMQVPVDSGRML